jgi:hypothetical protein
LDTEVTLIARHRETLLTQTLDLFAWDGSPNFPIRRLTANIDPFMGDAAERDRCGALFEPDVAVVTFVSINRLTLRPPHQTARRVVRKRRRIVKDLVVKVAYTSPGVFEGEYL